ncbi:bifunctional metallophosphatase/5'-nucleotidase [Endozoicomonas sp. G2_2]|uniref:bifunctional metallophosphatase/5'-nucleotidase n=1 Tax=Endozoicomonas sp. G2_2 TaxID=2821092 RepID=UPI001AD9F088|nr:bifunctional metallophosphatase/5'-nucleotidase [Endozoicomonas sp. G2_2]MBO9471167.1 bifunctional metallophosphatase/5'-nucleotidase [Endozoicomonas sp. G2_2]
MTKTQPVWRRLALLALLTASIAGCSSSDDNDNDSGDMESAAPAYRLQLLHFADMDGSTAALEYVSNFSRLINAFESDEELADNTLVLSSGDNFIPGPRFFAAGVDNADTRAALRVPGNGRGDIVFVNAFDTAASVVGNHDLDQGTEAFAGLIVADGDYPGTAFPYLSTNLDFSTDANLSGLIVADGMSASDGAGRVAGSATVEVGGETIGLVGASTPALASLTSTGGITVSPSGFTMDEAGYDALAAEIQPAIDALVDAGIDKIVLMAHMQQIAIEQALATRLNDVDIIIAGGSNTLLADGNDTLRDGDTAADTYPLSFEGPDGTPTLVVNVDGDYKYLGRLVVDFDEAGVLITRTLDSSENGAWASTDAVVEMLATRGLDTSADEDVLAVQSALQDVLAEQDGNVQGITDVYLDGRRTQVRTEETNLGDLTADANLYYARLVEPGVQVSLKNGGGIRDDIGQVVVPPGSNDAEPEFRPPQANESIGKPAGGVSQFDIAGSLRFNNSLTLITVTAAELRDIMEHAVAATTDGATPGQFPQIGGMRIAFDADETARVGDQTSLGASTAGSRIRTLELIDDAGTATDTIVANGVLQGDASRGIRMVLLAFTAACVPGDNYDAGTQECGDAYPLMNLADPQRVDLDPATATDPSAVSTAYDPGLASFAASGTEQDALAEHLQALYNPANGGSAYAQAETPAVEDTRIVNLKAQRDAP